MNSAPQLMLDVNTETNVGRRSFWFLCHATLNVLQFLSLMQIWSARPSTGTAAVTAGQMEHQNSCFAAVFFLLKIQILECNFTQLVSSWVRNAVGPKSKKQNAKFIKNIVVHVL